MLWPHLQTAPRRNRVHGLFTAESSLQAAGLYAGQMHTCGKVTLLAARCCSSKRFWLSKRNMLNARCSLPCGVLLSKTCTSFLDADPSTLSPSSTVMHVSVCMKSACDKPWPAHRGMVSMHTRRKFPWHARTLRTHWCGSSWCTQQSLAQGSSCATQETLRPVITCEPQCMATVPWANRSSTCPGSHR